MSWQSGDPEARPTVYLPQSDGETPLAYETYADPAEAHGWRKAYTDGEDTSVLPVVAGGQLVGLLTTENLGEFMLIQSALSKAASQRQARPPRTE